MSFDISPTAVRIDISHTCVKRFSIFHPQRGVSKAKRLSMVYTRSFDGLHTLCRYFTHRSVALRAPITRLFNRLRVFQNPVTRFKHKINTREAVASCSTQNMRGQPSADEFLFPPRPLAYRRARSVNLSIPTGAPLCFAPCGVTAAAHGGALEVSGRGRSQTALRAGSITPPADRTRKMAFRESKADFETADRPVLSAGQSLFLRAARNGRCGGMAENP